LPGSAGDDIIPPQRTVLFYGANLTPDKDSSLGNWTTKQINNTFQTGVRPDGRHLAPPMRAPTFAKLAKSDARAILRGARGQEAEQAAAQAKK
jgi:hypothetical protein